MTLFQNQYRVESARLADWDYSQRGWYFVTICTKDKQCSLGRTDNRRIILSEAEIIAETELKAVSTHYANVTLDRFVVMPNHVHAIVVIEGRHPYSCEPSEAAAMATARTELEHPRGSLSTIVGSYKAGVSRICGLRGVRGFQWQTRFHDHMLRSNASVNAVRDYIDQNPQNWMADRDNPDRDNPDAFRPRETRQAASLR